MFDFVFLLLMRTSTAWMNQTKSFLWEVAAFNTIHVVKNPSSTLCLFLLLLRRWTLSWVLVCCACSRRPLWQAGTRLSWWRPGPTEWAPSTGRWRAPEAAAWATSWSRLKRTYDSSSTRLCRTGQPPMKQQQPSWRPWRRTMIGCAGQWCSTLLWAPWRMRRTRRSRKKRKTCWKENSPTISCLWLLKHRSPMWWRATVTHQLPWTRAASTSSSWTWSGRSPTLHPRCTPPSRRTRAGRDVTWPHACWRSCRRGWGPACRSTWCQAGWRWSATSPQPHTTSTSTNTGWPQARCACSDERGRERKPPAVLTQMFHNPIKAPASVLLPSHWHQCLV